MSYTAVGLNDKLEKGRISGTLTIDTSKVDFTSSSGEVITFPMKEINISSGGTGNRLIYFKHPGIPDWTIYTGDTSILKDPHLTSFDSGRKSVSKISNNNKVLWGIIASIVILFIGALLAVFLLRHAIVRSIANNVPVEWEQKAGEQIFESVKLQSPLITDTLLNQEINDFGNQVTRSVKDKTFKFKFYIVKDSTLNAFALPGGNVVINSGLIMKAETPEEILGVIGHEIAHVTERHHARGLINRMGLNFLLSTFFTTGSDLADLIINTGGSLTSLQYDRSLEAEADDKGWEYLVDSNIDPQGMISFFKKLESKDSTMNAVEGNLSWLSTHPATGERIEELQNKRQKMDEQKFTPNKFDLKAFQKQLAIKL